MNAKQDLRQSVDETSYNKSLIQPQVRQQLQLQQHLWICDTKLVHQCVQVRAKEK